MSELTNLKMEDVDLKDKVIHVIGKGQKYRKIPISNKLYTILIEYLDNRKSSSNYFFVTRVTAKVSNQYINLCLKEAVKKAEINKDISCHSLRHSFASNLLLKGATIQDVRELMGHADVKTTSIYLHSIAENLRSSVNLLLLLLKQRKMKE
ncbi:MULTISPECIES: tyrosine-type recombinase/integrase [Clostridium]|uniref:Tyrosine-type recombinase/integrase n=1 Tax=Clostridium frigoriphilum TaxID=443253 RepID=A0ABU7UWL4_9CLOT